LGASRLAAVVEDLPMVSPAVAVRCVLVEIAVKKLVKTRHNRLRQVKRGIVRMLLVISQSVPTRSLKDVLGRSMLKHKITANDRTLS
jgi:hypothetical protein